MASSVPEDYSRTQELNAESGEGFRLVVCRPELQPENLQELETTTSLKTMLTEGKRINGVEAWSNATEILVANRSNEHGLVQAVRLAYSCHIPLELSPDHLWNAILQGVSNHIEKNSEELRSKFVNFDGKKTLEIIRDGFTKGSPHNDWAGCFDEWCEQIEGFIGSENKEKLCPEFSTTGPLEIACMNATLMDAMKSYFEYSCMTCCGIKAVKLQGTQEDWERILHQVSGLREYGLDWWVDYLEPIFETILQSYMGEEIHPLFWESIYKYYSGAGSGTVPSVDGWITHLFPYTRSGKQSHNLLTLEELYARGEEQSKGQRSFRQPPGFKRSAVPTGIAETPFLWKYNGTDIDMKIYSGFAGAQLVLNDNGEIAFIKPVQFWAIGEKQKR